MFTMIKMWMEKVCITYYNKEVLTFEQEELGIDQVAHISPI